MQHTRTSLLSRTPTTPEISPPRFARTLSLPSSSRKLRHSRLSSPTLFVSASCRNVTGSNPPRRIRKRRSGRRRKRRSSEDGSERIVVVRFHLAQTMTSLTVTAMITTIPPVAMTGARVLVLPPVLAPLMIEAEIAPTKITVPHTEIVVLSHALTAGSEALIIAIGGLVITRTTGKVVLRGLALTNPPPGAHPSTTPATGAESAPVEVAGTTMSPISETAASVPLVMTASMASVHASALPLRAPCLLLPPKTSHPTPQMIALHAWPL